MYVACSNAYTDNRFEENVLIVICMQKYCNNTRVSALIGYACAQPCTYFPHAY